MQRTGSAMLCAQAETLSSAECGKYAAVRGTKCPLNTWYDNQSTDLSLFAHTASCSQFGFCGTTKGTFTLTIWSLMLNIQTEFCDAECQSNCVEHPKPPGSSGGDILNRGEKCCDDNLWPKSLTENNPELHANPFCTLATPTAHTKLRL